MLGLNLRPACQLLLYNNLTVAVWKRYCMYVILQSSALSVYTLPIGNREFIWYICKPTVETRDLTDAMPDI
jgi:hypothetical protein